MRHHLLLCNLRQVLLQGQHLVTLYVGRNSTKHRAERKNQQTTWVGKQHANHLTKQASQSPGKHFLFCLFLYCYIVCVPQLVKQESAGVPWKALLKQERKASQHWSCFRNDMQCFVAAHQAASNNTCEILTVNSTKYFWLFSPTQLLTHGQWWSIFRIHLLQTLKEDRTLFVAHSILGIQDFTEILGTQRNERTRSET